MKRVDVSGETTLLFVITRLACDRFSDFECWYSKFKWGEFNTLTLEHPACCRDGEEGRTCDALCSLEKILKGEYKTMLEKVLVEDTMLAIVSPFSTYYPHGIWHVHDILECILELWINHAYSESIAYILDSKLVPLMKLFLDEKSFFLPDPLFIRYVKLSFDRYERILVNNVMWLHLNKFKDVDKCIEWFKNRCMKEGDEGCLKALNELAAYWSGYREAKPTM